MRSDTPAGTSSPKHKQTLRRQEEERRGEVGGRKGDGSTTPNDKTNSHPGIAPSAGGEEEAVAVSQTREERTSRYLVGR